MIEMFSFFVDVFFFLDIFFKCVLLIVENCLVNFYMGGYKPLFLAGREQGLGN